MTLETLLTLHFVAGMAAATGLLAFFTISLPAGLEALRDLLEKVRSRRRRSERFDRL